MFCSGCGQPVAPGQPLCSQCGRPVAPPIPPIPNFEFQLQTYAGRVRALSIVWFVYAGLSLLLGFVGMTFFSAFLMHAFGPWGNGFDHGPFGPGWFGPAFIHLFWAMILVRTALALVAGWGLLERAPWGRVVAIVAAIFSLIKFPIGTALGIWTLVTLLGYRNSTLYDQL
ncbi:MAG: hypothetical protein WBD67_08395 [Terracidiphilus sp.]